MRAELLTETLAAGQGVKEQRDRSDLARASLENEEVHPERSIVKRRRIHSRASDGSCSLAFLRSELYQVQPVAFSRRGSTCRGELNK